MRAPPPVSAHSGRGFADGARMGTFVVNLHVRTLDPAPIDPKQSVRVGYKYLSDHPERLHLPASQLAREALETAFRCQPGPR